MNHDRTSYPGRRPPSYTVVELESPSNRLAGGGVLPYMKRCLFWFLLLSLTLALGACGRKQGRESTPAPALGVADARPGASKNGTKMYKKPSEAELRQKLSPLEYEVTQRDATEPPFNNRYWDNHEEGLYVDAASGEPLFSSRDKFDSGTGWPSFTAPVEPERIVSHSDVTHGMRRTEVRSRDGDSHLGHVFPDGPGPSGLRYCINSASLRFIPVAKLAESGYGEYQKLFTGALPPTVRDDDNSCARPEPGEQPGCEPTLETAILAGGCFWGMQDIIRKIPGVVATDVGYTGGRAGVTYEDMHHDTTGNAEAVRVIFDPKKLSFQDLLENWFFRMHDPTTPNRQGNDVGPQYRSVIFVSSPEQRAVAERAKQRVNASGKWPRPLVTEIKDAGPYTLAEGYHQDYLQKNPGGYSCHYLRDFPKLPAGAGAATKAR
jgi:peptide methionine sulfoxide reductase msrA/msrB